LPGKIQHIFFDLDRTLWDYESNCRAALHEIYLRLIEPELPVGFETFYALFQHENHRLWTMFSANQIEKEMLRQQRFRLTLKNLHFENNGLADQIEKAFILEMPAKNKLFPGTKEMLLELHGNYQLHILSNGFDEVQEHKLEQSGIRSFFGKVITSDLAGFRKPSEHMFRFALEITGAANHNSLMVGDDPNVDIIGARNAGILAVLFNTSAIEHSLSDLLEITHLSQIPELLSELEQSSSVL
jgi:putative hydrolase of the HAD superfamily